jgi:hypothetical protein
MVTTITVMPPGVTPTRDCVRRHIWEKMHTKYRARVDKTHGGHLVF